MPVKLSGPWSEKRVQDHLESARMPIRLACKNTRGYPIVASLWYLYRNDALWCATQPDAAVARFLEQDARCGFEVAGDLPPYRGVRGWGKARILPGEGPEILRRLIERYLGDRDVPLSRWLLARAENEIAIRIHPERLITWDYSERMKGAC
jgi:nitroimidazol reductase NimA-like FMN-containing flavoprotein (pyridoxamine 5'-phosphate oxidase superfamily)